jgi:phage FluMu protein Com
VLRAPAAPEYRPDPYTVECGTCGGWGKTLTKGHVAGKTERVCPTCKGLGFQSPDTPQPVTTSNGVGEVSFDLPSEEPLVTDGTDVWGSPKLLPDGQENPNYGKMPQYKNPTLP